MESHRCSGCRRDRQPGEFDTDLRGNRRRMCRECLVRNSISMHVKKYLMTNS